MIGPWESPAGDEEEYDAVGLYGALDAMVRLDPPQARLLPDDPIGSLRLPPAWVERYDRMIVVRHTYDNGEEATSERMCASKAAALHELARQVAALARRGYRVVEE